MVKPTTALIMAAGAGERFGAGDPKQFLALAGKPVLLWSVEKFASHEAVDGVRVVVPPGYKKKTEDLLAAARLSKIEAVVAGGATRQESVLIALRSLGGAGGAVLIHDAVRPCVPIDVIDRVVRALESHPAVVPTVPVVDTLFRADEGRIDALLDRADLYRAQTPQGFHAKVILDAHEKAAGNGYRSSDDSSLVFFAGGEVVSVAGDERNVKITYPADIELAERILGGE
jgi:2-C-methyl-D-erythritol 4-phosphate cytidylyltransferase/2-C-methyl-D-erythritol 2,4-cyclodiphosphate synthase